MKLRFRLSVCVTLLVLAAGGGCSEEGVERRARRAAEKMRESIPDVHAAAMEQDADPETVRAAQDALSALHEYMGELNGELDDVTINALQAFQRSQGLKDDGMLDGRTMEALQEAVRRQQAVGQGSGKGG